jgi:hypothetical protein
LENLCYDGANENGGVDKIVSIGPQCQLPFGKHVTSKMSFLKTKLLSQTNRIRMCLQAEVRDPKAPFLKLLQPRNYA